GIMPFLSKAQISRMVFMCGASLPSPIIKLLARYEDDPAALRAAGVEYACKQLEGLAAAGVDGLHVYTMNQPSIAQAACEALRACGAVS
ncbi:MAG: methylenetetrahydrofolate reductase, partial [Slackia sp.]